MVRAEVQTPYGVGGGGEASIKELGILLAAGIGIGGAALVGYRLASGCWPWDLICQAKAAAGGVKDVVKETLKSSYEAGKKTGDFILKQTVEKGGALTGPVMEAAQVRSLLQGANVTLVSAPETPEGYNPSNWTWQGPGGNLQCTGDKCTGQGPLMIGLPANMTLTEFCSSSPDSPMCKDVTLLPKKDTLLTSFFSIFGGQAIRL